MTITFRLDQNDTGFDDNTIKDAREICAQFCDDKGRADGEYYRTNQWAFDMAVQVACRALTAERENLATAAAIVRGLMNAIHRCESDYDVDAPIPAAVSEAKDQAAEWLECHERPTEIGPRIDRDETERLKAEIETLKAQSMNNAGNAMANYQAYERMLYQSADQDAENQRLKARVAELEAALKKPVELTDAMARAMYDAKDLWPLHRSDNQRELAWWFAKPRWDAAWSALKGSE